MKPFANVVCVCRKPDVPLKVYVNGGAPPKTETIISPSVLLQLEFVIFVVTKEIEFGVTTGVDATKEHNPASVTPTVNIPAETPVKVTDVENVIKVVTFDAE